jgi:hypothetical protein
MILARTAAKKVVRNIVIAYRLLIMILDKLFGVDVEAREGVIESRTSKVELLIIIQQGVIDIKHEEKFGYVAPALNKIFGKDRFSVIVVEIFDLDFESKLLGKIMSFHQKVSFLHVIDLFILLVIQRNLMRLASMVNMAKHFALQVNTPRQRLRLRDMRHTIHIIQHCPILVDRVQGAFHQLTPFQKEVDVVGKHLLPVAVALDLEHELAAGHPVCDLEGLV